MHLRNKTVQQLLSVILSVVMVLSMLPMEVLAQETPPLTTPMDLTAITEDTSGDGWSWTQSTKTLTLTGLTLTVSDDSTHALILPDGATIDLADGTASTLTGGSRSTVYSSGEVKLRGSGSLTVYGRGWRSATLDMFIPGTLTVEYDDPDGGAVLKTDEGTEGAAICANVTLDNGILRATGPDFASADDGSSVGLRGRLTTHGSSVEAQLTARTGYASYGLYFDKQGSGRGDSWTMGLGKVTATAGHALSRYSYGLYVDYSSVNALELDGTQLTAMGGESDQYGSQGVFAGEEVIVKNGAVVTATGGQVNSSYESVGFNAVSWLTVSGENSKVLGYGGTSVKGGSKGVRCDSRFTLTDGYVFGQGGVSCTSSRNVGVEFKRLIMESGKLEGISGSPDSSYQTWGGQFNAYGLYCTGTAKITGGELIGTANGTDRELDYSAYGFYGSDELTMSGGTLRATTGDTPNASSGTLAALSVTSNKCKVQLSGGTIYAKAGVSNDDRSYGMRILGTGSTLTMTNTEDAAQPLSLYVTGRNTALYATALADGGLLPEITASSAYDAEADTLTDGYTFSNKQYWKDGTAALSLSAAACLHSASDDTGLCTKCGKRVYEAVLLTDGAVTRRYAAAGEAFTAAQTEEHQGCTLRLLTDLIDDGGPLVHDPVVTITGGRFTLDLHGHTIAGKTSDYKEGVVTVTGGQLRIENGTLENLYTGNDSKAQALTLLGTDTHVTLANVTAIGATPPNGDTSISVYAPDGARLTIESGEFTGRVAGTYASAPTETPHVSIAGGTFHNGLSYSIHETEANAATLLAILKDGYALARTDGTLVDLGTEPSFSRFSGTYTLSGEVQVVAHTHDVRSGRPGYCACGYACPHDGQTADSYFTLPVCSLCGTAYGTLLKDLRTPSGKIIIDENNWWQDFLNTVTFGLFFPTGARFTIEATDDSVDHTGYDPELYPVTVEYLVTDQRYTSDKMSDIADQFQPYPGKAVALPDDQTSIVYARITDWAGNVTYLSTDDLTVDATAPEISSDVAENQIYCEDGLRIAFRDDHLKSVTLNGTEMTYTAEGGWYVLWLSAASGSQEGQQTLTVTDEAGNGTTLHFQWYAGHDFDDTGLCSHCGLQAEARWNDAFFPHLEDALTSADADEDGARFTSVVMLTNASLSADAFSLDGIRAVLALEGHTLTLSAPMTLEQSSGNLTIRDSTSSGKITGQALTVKGGRLTVEAGCFENTLNLQAYNVTLFGGTFARITSEDAAYPRMALASRTAYQQADGQLIRRSDITPTLENVAVVSCPHDEIDGITCRICGTKMVAKVAKDDTLRYFADFEDAAQYAATLEGSAITLLRDALWSGMGLPTGTYTLDLNGKTLSGSNDLMIDGSFTICDSQGGGKLWRDGTIWVLGGHVAITGGQFNRVYLASDSADLSVTGGTFARIAYSGEDTSRTPLFFPAEGYTFQKADGNYANTGDVVMEENLRYLEDVTVTTPPFTITRYPVDTDLYPTTPVGYRPDFITEVTFHIPESSPTIEFQWYQVGDPDRIKSYGSAVAWQNPFTIYTFIDGPAQYYGIFSYKGYSVRTDVLTVRELTCDHPGVDADNRCSQCRAEVAASVELNGSTGYYLSLSEALALARTDAYRGCTLTVLRSSTDPISVNSGSFTLTAAQGVMLGGKVTLAKDAAVTLSGGSYTNSASIFGPNRIEGGTFYGAVALRDGSSVSGGSFIGAVTISDTVTVTGGTFTGDVTINHGGKLIASAGTFGNVNVKTGGGGALTGGHFGKITQIDGSPCAALLAEGYAYSDGGIINGYVPIIGGVDVVPHAQHQYVWLNQKLLCGCGHVADEDADAPVITGITDGETYYGDVTFTVTDAHDFTVTVDGQPAAAEDGLYALPADNASHEIVAVDVAGNRTTVTVSVYRTYTVTPPTGTGFTFTGETTVRHGQDYRFRVDIAPGYSKLPDYSLLVNGQTPGGMGDVDFDECLIPSVEGDLTITVTGVADITPPEAELTIAGNPFRQFLNTVTFGLFFKSTQTVTVTASDLGSGVDTAAWMLSDTVFASQDAITGSWTDLSLTDGSGSFSIQPGQKGYAYLRVTDRAGNITVLNSDGVVVYTDAQADTRQITYTKRSGQDVSFHVTLNGNTVTGVQLADGTPLAGFTAAEDGTVTLPAATLQALAAGDYTLYVTYAPLGVAYNARYEASEAPAMTSVALSVQKAEGSVAILDDVSRDYNGQPVETPAITSLGTGALTVEYRAQGGEFTTQAPKAVGSYTVRVTAAADDDYASASAQRNFRITAKRVTIDGVTVEPSKTYDGTTDATIVTGGTLSANFDGNDLRIVTGSAAYDGKNVGTGKTVSFSGFSLEGDAAENYTLASQPAGTTADITVRPVTVEDLHIQDKLYDGTDRAEYDGEPTLGNAVSGDDVALVKGTPSFTSIRAAEDIAIRFTEFSLTGADAGNYALTQPTGITASILPYALTGSEYAVNSNDWINHDFVVTAAEGYLLSLTDTADGVWQQTLRATDETAEGRLTFYVKDLSTGAISLQVTEQYRIDRTQPTGEIRVDERTAWQSFLSRITFGLFYREEQAVTITSADETSGVAATEYLLSAEDLDIPALEQETFLPYEKALALAPDGEYVVYARITDQAGNVTYLRSDGMVLDATAPAITGAENGGVYCAAVTLTITDAYPVTVSVNGAPVELTEGQLVLQPAEGTQLVTATDPAGNESRLEITVNDGHTWGDWNSNGDGTHTRTCTISGCGAPETESCTGGEATCVDRAVCEVCGGAYGDVDAHRHADLRHVEAKAATTEAPGNIEYWYCAACGKYFADAQASRELQQADTVTEQLPATPTGDEAPLTLWVIVLAACAGLALLLLVLRRRNSHRTA